MNFGALIKPKGILKILEIIFCICAFAVLVSYEEPLTFTVVCNPKGKDSKVFGSFGPIRKTTTTETPTTTTLPPTTTQDPENSHSAQLNISYPFKLEKIAEDVNVTECNKKNSTLIINDTVSSKAVFFVFVAVCAFLFAAIMVPVYLMDDVFASMTALPTIDLVIHVIFVLFWVCASITWAAGVSNLKTAVSEDELLELNMDEFKCNSTNENDHNTCKVDSPENYSGPVAAAVFGFIDLALFGVNTWFVYKETSYAS